MARLIPLPTEFALDIFSDDELERKKIWVTAFYPDIMFAGERAEALGRFHHRQRLAREESRLGEEREEREERRLAALRLLSETED
jgi:hypothetical protein